MKASQAVVAFLVLSAAVAWIGCHREDPHVPPDSRRRSIEPSGSELVDQFVTTSSGLRYLIHSKGNAKRARLEDTVVLRFRGWIRQPDGRLVPIGEPSNGTVARAYRLAETIPGWQEGIQLVGEGGRVELVVPPDLGYGSHGVSPHIPPNATLQFVIDVIEIER